MTNNSKIIIQQEIENHIFNLRGLQVMLDSHLAEMYNVDTKQINRAVKRNLERFPENFMFQLNDKEWEFLRYQIGTLKKEKNIELQIEIKIDNRGKHRKYLPFVFTEQGVAMLSAVLHSDTAIKVSIQVIQTFVKMREFVTNNSIFFQRIDNLERKQLETNDKFEQIFDALQNKKIEPNHGIFFNGQIFDSYSFIADIIRKANKSIILIDNYIDDTVLTLFTKRKKGVLIKLYTKIISKQLILDVEKFNTQYPPIEIKELKESHDRFLIIDEKELYHIGSSLKDIGKKWFAFSKMDIEAIIILNKLNNI